MKLGSNDISSVKIGSTDVNKIYIGSTEVWSSFTGLLDTYTGAAAAYSLRLLSSTYSGDAIRVRRASDNAESDIGFVSGQLDTSTLETFCSGTDGYVTTWYDQSGNGNDASQSTAASQPQIVSSGSVVLENSKNAIEFNKNALSLPSTLYNTWSVNNVSALIVTNITSGANQQAFQMNNAAGNRLAFGRADTTPNYGWRNNGIYQKTYNDSSLNQVLGSIYTAASKIYVNNNEAVTSENAPAASGTSFGGIGGLMQGTIQEIIIYNSDQSSNNIGIESNINNFYNIY